MNILILSNNLVVENQGAGYVVIITSKSLKELGHEVTIIPPFAFSFLEILGSKAINYRRAIGLGIWVYKNRKVISNFNLIIVYTAEFSIGLFLIKKILKIDIPVILHSNGIEVNAQFRLRKFEKLIEFHSPFRWYHLNKFFLFKYCYYNVQAILTVSNDERQFVVQHLKIPGEKVFYNEPSLPEIFFNEDEIKNTKKCIITYCGRWTSIKGKASMEEAIPLILRKFPNYLFSIIGVQKEFEIKNPFPDDIKDRVKIYPFIETKKEIIKLYRESQIFIFPSLTESFGLVLAEAMACGCAVITGPTGFAADLKNNVEAVVLEKPNGANLYSAVEEVILNEALRKRLVINGKKRTEILNIRNYKNNLENIMDTVMR